LKRARVDAGLTQVALAGRLRKPQSFVSKYEQGERSLDVLEYVAVARAIGLEPFDFLRDILK
jgi:transcriptional regulator with XRE-family HTH domain